MQTSDLDCHTAHAFTLRYHKVTLRRLFRGKRKPCDRGLVWLERKAPPLSTPNGHTLTILGMSATRLGTKFRVENLLALLPGLRILTVQRWRTRPRRDRCVVALKDSNVLPLNFVAIPRAFLKCRRAQNMSPPQSSQPRFQATTTRTSPFPPPLFCSSSTASSLYVNPRNCAWRCCLSARLPQISKLAFTPSVIQLFHRASTMDLRGVKSSKV
jgi:hypothetical protein